MPRLNLSTTEKVVLILSFAGIVLMAIVIMVNPVRQQAPGTRPADPVAARTPLSLADQAKVLVGFDDGGKLPADDDIRVNRATFLLQYLVDRTGKSHTDIAMLMDKASEDLKRDYGRQVPRLEILERVRKLDQSMNSKEPNLDLTLLVASVVISESSR